MRLLVKDIYWLFINCHGCDLSTVFIKEMMMMMLMVVVMMMMMMMMMCMLAVRCS